MLPQRTVDRVRIGVEFSRQLLDVEIGRQLSPVRIHAVIPIGGADMPFLLFPKPALALQSRAGIAFSLADWK